MAKPSLHPKKISTSPRANAINLIIQCNNGSFANDIVPSSLGKSKFSNSDKAMITKIVYSTLRNQIRIDYAISKISKKPLDKLDELALNALRSVVAQIIDKFEDHAVLNETVEVMPLSLKGFVNANARKALKLYRDNRLFANEPDNIKFSLPEWIYKNITGVFGDRSSEVASSFNEAAYVTLAPYGDNDLDIESSLAGTIISTSRLIRASGSISDIDVVKKGQALIMDQGSQLVAECLDTKNGETVLDLCSAPGGKSFFISRNARSVISSDVSESRMKQLIETRERLNCKNVFPIVSDARQIPLEGTFNRILVDAPCSGLGVLKRRPDARLRISESSITELVELQKAILDNAISFLDSGSVLLYSVCTFTQQETIGIDEWLQAKYPDLIAQDLSSISNHWLPVGRGYILPPGIENDGMYVLRLTSQ